MNTPQAPARFDEKTVIITGAATGVGRATALRFAAEGASLALTDINDSALEDLAAQLRASEVNVVTCAGDIVNPSIIADLVGRAESAYGHIDVLVNNVGILVLKSLADTTLEDFDRLMHVNCYSHLLAIQAATPAMRRGGGGAIVNVASVGGLLALPNVSAYGPSKAAVIGLTRAAAAEYAPHIRCNAVCPGGVDTDMARGHMASFDDKQAAERQLTGRQMIPRYARPREIASVIAYLSSDEASFVTGSIVTADAGHSAW